MHFNGVAARAVQACAVLEALGVQAREERLQEEARLRREAEERRAREAAEARRLEEDRRAAQQVGSGSAGHPACQL